jgi:hypothetical protein
MALTTIGRLARYSPVLILLGTTPGGASRLLVKLAFNAGNVALLPSLVSGQPVAAGKVNDCLAFAHRHGESGAGYDLTLLTIAG